MEKKNSRFKEPILTVHSSSAMKDELILKKESTYLIKAPSQISGAGIGLYTSKAISKGKTISIYLGETISKKESLKRADKGLARYIVEKPDGTLWDSLYSECFAKYANDAEAFKGSSFKNNAEIRMDEDDEVCLMALRRIKEGEEIFCGYGEEYWKDHLSMMERD